MSQRNVERLRPVVREWERGNFAAGADILSQEVVLSAFVSGGTVVCQGWEEMGRFLRDFFGQWREYRITVEKLRPLDDSTVVLEGRQHGVGKGSGIEISDSLTIVFTFEQGKVTAMYWHPYRDEAFKAAGLQQ
jgi:SnoaL-like domain